MEKILEYIKTYIDENARIINWNDEAERKLSLVLAASFSFFKAEILGESILFLKPATDVDFSVLAAWMDQIEQKMKIPAAVVLESVSPYMMKRLIRERTAFLVPGKQMYLPFLAMHITAEKNKVHADRKKSKFTPGTQMIFLYILYSEAKEFSAETLADALQLSPMTVSRGLADLCDSGLLTYEAKGQTGRKKMYHCIEKTDYFRTGKKYLDNPIRDTVYVSELPDNCKAVKSDHTALSEQTMLGEPQQSFYAAYVKDRNDLDPVAIPQEQAMVEKKPVIQLMKYNIILLAQNGYIDPISMIYSLSEQDDRVEMAVQKLMAKYDWYESEKEEW